MFTDCPSCRRQFRIRADQLSAAGGLVQCGFCGRRYNALERLHDRPQTVPVDSDDAPGEEPWFDVPAPAAAPGPETAVSRSGDAGTAPVTPESRSDADDVPVDEQREAAGAIPSEWLLEETPRPGRRFGWLWFTGIGILLLVLAAQLAWFHRDRLLEAYPRLLPWARQVCEHFHCELIRYRDLDSIEVLNRDVRDHPRYQDALLVNATISNQARDRQPFPLVQLNLFDTAGTIIAYRRFRPREYLDESIDIERGMLPGKPVHIVLEVTGPTAGAVSFEFRFLHR